MHAHTHAHTHTHTHTHTHRLISVHRVAVSLWSQFHLFQSTLIYTAHVNITLQRLTVLTVLTWFWNIQGWFFDCIYYLLHTLSSWHFKPYDMGQTYICGVCSETDVSSNIRLRRVVWIMADGYWVSLCCLTSLWCVAQRLLHHVKHLSGGLVLGQLWWTLAVIP